MILFPARAAAAVLCAAAALVLTVCGLASPTDALVYFSVAAVSSAAGVAVAVRACREPWQRTDQCADQSHVSV